MKLFVVGEDSPNPNNWSIWSEFSIVVASNEAEALELAGARPEERICEIPMDKAAVLVRMPEPPFGDDI